MRRRSNGSRPHTKRSPRDGSASQGPGSPRLGGAQQRFQNKVSICRVDERGEIHQRAWWTTLRLSTLPGPRFSRFCIVPYSLAGFPASSLVSGRADSQPVLHGNDNAEHPLEADSKRPSVGGNSLEKANLRPSGPTGSHGPSTDIAAAGQQPLFWQEKVCSFGHVVDRPRSRSPSDYELAHSPPWSPRHGRARPPGQSRRPGLSYGPSRRSRLS